MVLVTTKELNFVINLFICNRKYFNLYSILCSNTLITALKLDLLSTFLYEHIVDTVIKNISERKKVRSQTAFKA